MCDINPSLEFREYKYQPEKMTWDPHCYECKVRYRDPKPKDLVMYLHAWRYKVGWLFSLTFWNGATKIV